MAQVGWVFLDDFGKRHRVGLYHGDQSGHLVIHCDLRVVQIDFSVKESATYSFFIEDEFCEVQLIKEHGIFSYAFEVNKKVDTPRNRLRQQDNRRNRKHLFIFIGILVAVLIATLLLLKEFGRSQEQNRLLEATGSSLSPEQNRLLNTLGKRTVSRLLLVDESAPRRVFYNFRTADSVEISGTFAVPETGAVILPNGFPLNNYDEFSLTYLPDDPHVHRLDFGQPTETTVITYLKKAVEAEQKNHPDQSASHSLCRASTALRLRGWRSLAHFIFQDSPPGSSAEYDRDTYQRLVRDPQLKTAFDKNCWDK